MKVLSILLTLAALASCATMALRQTRTVDELTGRVRIHSVGLQRCWIEVISATETLTTTPTRCVVVPHRARP